MNGSSNEFAPVDTCDVGVVELMIFFEFDFDARVFFSLLLVAYTD